MSLMSLRILCWPYVLMLAPDGAAACKLAALRLRFSSSIIFRTTVLRTSTNLQCFVPPLSCCITSPHVSANAKRVKSALPTV